MSMKNQKIILIIIIVILQLGSCKSLKNNNELKKAILESDLFYTEILFLSIDEKDQVGHITIYNLRRNLFYDKKYNTYNLDSLVSESLKGNYSFNCFELDGCFEISANIEKSYKDLSFKSFLKKFTRYLSASNCFMICHELTENEKKKVAYFLYLNGYYTSHDDYDNHYYSTKAIAAIEIEEFYLDGDSLIIIEK